MWIVPRRTTEATTRAHFTCTTTAVARPSRDARCSPTRPIATMRLTGVDIQPLATARLASVIGPERAGTFERTASLARSALGGRKVVNVNSTATGGGVAELLQTLLAYARGAGIDARWVV